MELMRSFPILLVDDELGDETAGGRATRALVDHLRADDTQVITAIDLTDAEQIIASNATLSAMVIDFGTRITPPLATPRRSAAPPARWRCGHQRGTSNRDSNRDADRGCERALSGSADLRARGSARRSNRCRWTWFTRSTATRGNSRTRRPLWPTASRRHAASTSRRCCRRSLRRSCALHGKRATRGIPLDTAVEPRS